MNRWLALALALFGGALAAWFGAMGAFAIFYGVLWIFVFGDSPWPQWVDAALPVLLLLVAIPGAVAVAWAVYVRWRLGWPATSVQEFTAPLYGYVDAWRRGWSKAGNWGDAVGAIALVPFAAATVVRWWQRRPSSLLLDAALPFADALSDPP